MHISQKNSNANDIKFNKFTLKIKTTIILQNPKTKTPFFPPTGGGQIHFENVPTCITLRRLIRFALRISQFSAYIVFVMYLVGGPVSRGLSARGLRPHTSFGNRQSLLSTTIAREISLSCHDTANTLFSATI